jgi:hypothetical protein
MKPAYWIGIMALAGAILAYAINKLVGMEWLDTGLGTAIGIIVGVIIYEKEREKTKGK